MSIDTEKHVDDGASSTGSIKEQSLQNRSKPRNRDLGVEKIPRLPVEVEKCQTMPRTVQNMQMTIKIGQFLQ